MRRMNSLLAVVGVWVSVVVAGVAPVSAQTAPAPRIFSVVPDLSGTTLVISGLRFGEGAEVWGDGQLVPVLPGATQKRLEVDVPAAWRVQPGTYRLVVRTAQARTDTFEVTEGGGGAWGATGAGPEGRPAGSPTEGGAAAGSGAGSVRRVESAAPGGTPPGIAPSLVEQSGPPYATAVGYLALASNTATGYSNTAAGYGALYANTTGSDNTAAGPGALWSNTTGDGNVASGYRAGYAATGSSNVYVANEGLTGENGTIRIGTAGTHTDTYLAGTVRATAFVGDGSGLTNLPGSAGSGGSSMGPTAPGSQAVLDELQAQHRTITAQAGQLDALAKQLTALRAAQAQQQTAQAGQLRAQAQHLATLQQRLTQLEARLGPSRSGGTRWPSHDQGHYASLAGEHHARS